MNNEICCLRGQADESETENIRFRHKQEPSNQINPELALCQSEEKFRLAFHTSPDSINFNRLSDGMYIDINEGFTKLTGYTREDAIGKSSVDLNIWYDPKDRQLLVKALQSEGYVENLEARFRRKNGLIGVGLMSARVLRLNQEDVILSITRDITERKQVEDALRESENKYGQLVESLTDAILVWSGEHIIYANPTALKLFRANQAGDLIGKRYLDFVHPDDRLESVERIKKSKNEKWIAPHREHRMITADGQVIHVESTGVPIQCHGQIQHFGIFSDITERKKIEEELRENLLFLRQTERIAQIGGWKANIKTDELMWTEGVHQITETPLDYKPGLEEGLRFYDPESIPVIKNALTRALKNGSPFAIQAKVNTRTGKQLWAEVRGLQQVVEGEKTSVVGTFQDITERRQAEEALRKSEEQYRAIFENAIEGFFQSTPEGRFIRVNKALAKMCGYASPEEMVSTIGDIGEQHYESKKDREIFLALLNEKGVVENFEHQTFRKDGSTFWVSVSARAVKDNDNRILYYEGSHVDIDERKRADKRLIDAKEQYRSLFDTSTNAILIRNRAGIITMVNKAAMTLLQAEKQEELIGRPYLELVHPEDRALSDERVERIFKFAVEQRKPRKLEEDIIRPREHRMITLHGDTIDVESTGIAYQYKGEFCIQGIFRDITARKLAEEHLRETEKQYRELAESLPQVIFEIDLNGNLKYLNQIGFQLFGYTPEEISKGFNVLEAFIPENRERLALDIMLNVQGQMFGRKDYTALRKDGTKFPAGVHASRVMSGQTATGVRGILIDLTSTERAKKEKKKLEIQLQQAQKMEAIGALAGGIAHDFNNILSAIIGYTELAMLNEGAEHCTAELKEALIAANRAKELVKQILAFSRQTDEERMPVRVALVAKEAVKFLRATIPATIEIKTRIDEKSGAILANSVELHQIIMNLCTNAVHAIGDNGGVLDIEVQDADIDHAEKNGFLDLEVGSYVRISVNDTGDGMHPDVMRRIFDPYFTTKEKGVGTGLGLAVVHGIVKKSGGAIKVESEPGKGTTFHIYLPKADIAAPIKAEQPKPIRGGSERILFVDDEKMLVDIGQQVLQRLGYDVVSRTSPIEALELFKAKPNFFDLVITDKTMPGMTGDALAKELISIRPDLPVIICTGYSQSFDQERAKQIGIKAFVMKPILINEIAAAVRKVLD